MPNAYDRVLYPGQPYIQAHPAALGVFAKLFGLPFAPFETCRMLEIGCGDGVNLINLALSAPRARFVGVDLAEAPIAQARADAKVCGCDNVEFVALDLRDIDAALGEFDYIVAHGVLAWVPEVVRAALFPVIGSRLAPHGLAMVSFNALPGARAWQAMRDMLLYETSHAEAPEAKLRLAIEFLERSVAHWPENEADGRWMIGVARRILGRAPEVLFHDEMGEFYAPQLLADVAASAAAQGMTYLADTRPHMSEEALFPTPAAAPLRDRAGGDWTRFQQYLDFQRLRTFHNAVFVKGAPDHRRVAGRLPGLWASCNVREVEPDPAKPNESVFETVSNLRMSTNDPRLVALFREFAQAYPQALPLDGVANLEAVADHVFRLFLSGVLSLSTAPPRLAREGGERPLASPLARLQAARGESELATLSHGVLRIEGGPLPSLIALLDGTRGRADLAADWAAVAGLEEAQARDGLGEALEMLARAGVLRG